MPVATARTKKSQETVKTSVKARYDIVLHRGVLITKSRLRNLGNDLGPYRTKSNKVVSFRKSGHKICNDHCATSLKMHIRSTWPYRLREVMAQHQFSILGMAAHTCTRKVNSWTQHYSIYLGMAAHKKKNCDRNTYTTVPTCIVHIHNCLDHTHKKKKSPWGDLNSRPLVYKTSALTPELQRHLHRNRAIKSSK